MTEIILPESPIFHLAIDVQDRYLRNLRYEARKKTVPQEERAFADELRQLGVPTIWVVYQDGFYFRADSPDRPAWLKEAGLAVDVRSDELVMSKGDMSPFKHPLLADALHRANTKKLIITGMETTSGCVFGGIVGGVANGFTCDVVYDLLADGSARALFDVSPDAHRRFLGYGSIPGPLTSYLEKTFFQKKAEVITMLKREPARPLRAAPVTYHALLAA